MLQSTFAAVVPLVCVVPRGHGRDGRRGVPREGRADADRRTGRDRPRVRPRRRVLLWGRNATSFGGTLQADNFGLFICLILVVVGILTIALSGPSIEREHLPAGEYYA